MIGDKKTKDYYLISIMANMQYCKKHKLDFHAKIGRVLSENEYAPHFDRYAFCLKKLEDEKYENVLYIDCDACVQKRSKNDSINKYIKKLNESSKSILASYDFTDSRSCLLNSGVLLIKNTKIGKDFCKSVLLRYPECHIKGCWCGFDNQTKFKDQCVIEKLTEFHKHILLVPRNTLQCLAPSDRELDESNAFIMHLAGNNKKDRVVKMSRVCM
tara:strand:+ start:2065 stop:2706 length:642 start_codon:yes stop_codon:yes gene_type:complete